MTWLDQPTSNHQLRKKPNASNPLLNAQIRPKAKLETRQVPSRAAAPYRGSQEFEDQTITCSKLGRTMTLKPWYLPRSKVILEKFWFLKIIILHLSQNFIRYMFLPSSIFNLNSSVPSGRETFFKSPWDVPASWGNGTIGLRGVHNWQYRGALDLS